MKYPSVPSFHICLPKYTSLHIKFPLMSNESSRSKPLSIQHKSAFVAEEKSEEQRSSPIEVHNRIT